MKRVIAIATIAIMLTAVIPPPLYGANAPLAYADGTRIDASGATFAFPLMDLWRVEYKKVEDVDPNYV